MKKAKHAHGLSTNVDDALQAGTINAYDVLFLDAETDNPKIGWVSKTGKKIIVNENLDADIDTLETEIAKKANSEEVEAKIDTAVLNVIDIANAYTDSKVAEAAGGVVEIIEF